MRKILAFIGAFLWASVLWSATAVTVTPGASSSVYRGTSVIGTVPDDNAPVSSACIAAARADAATRAPGTYSYGCQPARDRLSITVTADEPPPPPPPPPATGGPTISVSPTSYAQGGYATLSWKCSAPCTRSAVPADERFAGDPRDDWSISVAPNVTTTYTVTDASGSASVTLTVTGSPPVDPPPPGGGDSGGGTGGGTPPPPPVTNLPVPPVLPQPIVLPVTQIAATDPIRKYAETARRNWNFEGHVVPVPFSRDQGFWEYETCTQDYAVWLFDRPSAWFKLAAMTGDAGYRDQAISDFRYWAGKINAQGYFSCKTGEADTKYLELESFLFYEQATGDQSFRPVADRVYAQSAQGFDVTYSPGLALWTEREVGIHLGAAVDYYRLTGNQQALARAASLVRHWGDMAGAVGAPLVSYTQHEGGGPGGSQPTNPVSSPWMAALYFQFARNYWQVTGDEAVLRQASAYFDWLDTNGLYDGSLAHPELSGVTIPRYLTGELIGDAGYDYGNINHCPSVQGFVAFAVDAKGRLGQPIARAQQRLTELQGCTVRMWAYWTRTATQFPRYRIQNPRMWNLWVRGLYEAQR